VRRAVVIGSGPNGLAAAVTMAQAGWQVTVHEAQATIGGGVRSAELTLPGFLHDVCSAIHPLGERSPCFRGLELPVEWIHPHAPAAHPLEDGTAVLLERSIDETADGLGPDGDSYRALFGPLEAHWAAVEPVVVGPHPPPPRHVLGALRMGPGATIRTLRAGLAAARPFADSAFTTERARALFAGHAAHSMLSLDTRPSAGFALFLIALAHVYGWALPRGGSQRLTDALADRLRELGGEIESESPVEKLPKAEVVLADVVPRELLRIAGDRLPARYARALGRYRYGPGAFKLDWALDGPIPWRAEECRRAATVHLGGSLREIAASEREPVRGGHAERPFVLLVQPTVFDESRAPPGKHIAWAYCHVPNGSDTDMSERIEAQIERFAPGFRKLVLARAATRPADFERRNRNIVGGDINGGAMDLGQLVFRPVRRLIPYRTPLSGLYICSSATPPGGGVHGMCGYSAALVALRDHASRP
jgi:phytoene dehydrogenase-like protein